MDEMIYRIRYWWHHYKLKYSFIFIILIAVADVLISKRISAGLSGAMSPFSQSYELLIFPVHLASFVLSLISIAVPVMVIRYRDETGGRDCFRDMRETGRTYRDLIAYYRDSDPYRLDLSDFPVGKWDSAEGVILGHVGRRVICRSAFTKGGEGNNFALFALPGAGKTTCQIIPTALRFGGSVLAIDIKGDILNVTKNKRRIKVFAPDDPEHSCHYDPLAGIKTMSAIERRTYLEQVAAVIVPEDKENKYWHETARAYFIGIALYCLEWNIITLPEIADEILQGNAVDWVLKIKESGCSDAQLYTDSLYGNSAKNLSGSFAELAKCVRPFSYGSLADVLSGGGDMITPATLDAGIDVYVEIPQDKIAIYAPVTSIMITDFMTSFMRKTDVSSGKRIQPVLFLLDEFPQLDLGDPKILLAALSTLRSRCVSIFLCMQSISQLTEKYGENGFRSIMDCCQNISIMSMQDPDSRRWAQSLIGSKKVIKVSTSVGGKYDSQAGRSTQEVLEPIFQPEDFGNLGSKVLIYMNGRYVIADKTPWYA